MYANILSALDTYLESTLPAEALDVAWDSVGYLPQANRPYLRPKMSAYTRVESGPGPQTVFLESGSYTVTAVFPAGSGTGALAAEASKIVAMFPRGTSLALANQAPLIFQSGAAAPIVDNGDWIEIPVIIQWNTSELSS